MIFYHGTALANAPSIKEHGLIPHGGKGADAWALDHTFWGKAMVAQDDSTRKASVYITQDISIAAWYADISADELHSAPCVFKIELPEDEARKLHKDEQGAGMGRLYPAPIPRAWLSEIPWVQLRHVPRNPLPNPYI